MQISTFDVGEQTLTIPKMLGGKARGRKKVRMATKWDKVRRASYGGVLRTDQVI
jgi:hypothetical protein